VGSWARWLARLSAHRSHFGSSSNRVCCESDLCTISMGSPAVAATRRVLILGAGGQLGKVVGSTFGARQWIALGADTHATPVTGKVIMLDPQAAPERQANTLQGELGKILGQNLLDAVINVAGGFAMGDAADAAVVQRTRSMVESSVYSSVISAHVASSLLRPGGLLILPGAAAALSATGWSIPYGTAKAAVHHLVRSLGDAEAAGMPSGAKTIGLAPQVLDTPQNREAMPDADTGAWATLDEVASQLEAWCAEPAGVESGKVYVVQKVAGAPATFEPRSPL